LDNSSIILKLKEKNYEVNPGRMKEKALQFAGLFD